MSGLHFFSRTFLACAVFLDAGAALCQEFPNKPIRILASDPGGGNDLVARMIAQTLTSSSGWQVIVDYASGGAGTTAHLAAELFKSMAGVDIVRIPYKGTRPALNDLIGGHVQLMFGTAGSVAPHIRSGRLRSLAVSGSGPSALFPGLPTIAASGLPGYEVESTHSLFAPAATARPIINRLNEEILRALNRADVKERFLNSGTEAVGGSPEQLAATMKSEMARLGKVIQDAGIQAD